MNKQISQYMEKINALAVRERVLIFSSMTIVIIFLWWNYYAQPLLAKAHQMQQEHVSLVKENGAIQLSVDSIDNRIKQGVHKTGEQRLITLRQELQRVNALLQQKTLELIEPDEMFELMQQLLFADSQLKLTQLKRKHVRPTFNLEEEKDNQYDEQQPEIYRHVMQIKFEGSYQKIVDYLNRLEEAEWKLIWDRITLKTMDYPLIQADIEISTLSDDRHWVGL